MARIQLKAGNTVEQVILDYLEKNASEELVQKINTGKKGMCDCFNYIKEEARKKAVNGCSVIEDREVFGWAIHYFEEDKIKPHTQSTINAVVKTASDTVPIPKAEEKQPKAEKKKKQSDNADVFEGQMNIMDFLGG